MYICTYIFILMCVFTHGQKSMSGYERHHGLIQELRSRLDTAPPHKVTLPETNMETPKGPYKDYSPSKRGLYGFPC